MSLGKFVGLFVERVPTPQERLADGAKLSSVIQNPGKKSVQAKLRRRYNYRIDLVMKNWRAAVMAAEDTDRPRREYLYRLYQGVIDDAEVLTQMRTAMNTVQLGEYTVVQNGKDNEELKKLFETPWFFNYLRYAVESEMYGHSLIEFADKDEAGRFQNVSLIPREHVRPEYQDIVINPLDEEGFSYLKGKYSKTLIEIGERNDLGLLKAVSKAAIKKEYAETDWARRNEKFGVPFVVVKTATQAKAELDKKETMLSNLGSNSWAILDDEDEMTFLESKAGQGAHLTFADNVALQDKYIAKIINGQTSTSDEKAYVGSAEVHERILNDYTLARMRRIQYHINFELIPFLVGHGYPLVNAEFKFADLEHQEETKETTPSSDAPNDKPDEDPDDAPKPNASEKKKLSAEVGDAVRLSYETDACCDHDFAPLAFDVGNIIDNAVRNVYDRKVKAGDQDAKAWKTTVENLWDAAQKGTGKKFIETAYTHPTFELKAQFRQNIFVFAAFKNHSRISDMVAALVDANGEPRSWKDFKAAAQQINNTYFEGWLRAEYDTAVGSAQMAVKWKEYEANAAALPYLQYVTMGDERVRETHKMLDGVTLPLTDPFWDEFYPPNGWRCRCTVLQVAGGEQAPTIVPNDEQVHPAFRNHPGKSGELFPQSHPYFEGIPEPQRERLLKAANRLAYDNFYPDSGYKKIGFDNKTGGYLVEHPNQNPQERDDNRKMGTAFMKLGNPVDLIEIKTNKKTPDAIVSGLLWEFKKINGGVKNGVQLQIKRGKKQAERISIELPTEFNVRELTLAIYTAVIKNDLNEKVKELAFLIKGKLVRITRKEIEDGSYIAKIQKAVR